MTSGGAVIRETTLGLQPVLPGLRDPAPGARGEERKQRGQALAASHGAAWLRKAREAARLIAEQKGWVTSDDVIEAVELPPSYVHRNVIGAIFSDRPYWELKGYVKSRRPEAHARRIGVWKLRGREAAPAVE